MNAWTTKQLKIKQEILKDKQKIDKKTQEYNSDLERQKELRKQKALNYKHFLDQTVKQRQSFQAKKNREKVIENQHFLQKCQEDLVHQKKELEDSYLRKVKNAKELKQQAQEKTDKHKTLKLKETQEDQERLHTEIKNLEEREKSFSSFMKEKVKKLPNEEKLQQLVPPQKTLKEELREAEEKEASDLKKDLENYQATLTQEHLKSIQKKKDYTQTLRQQMQEKSLREKEFKDLIEEQGAIWKQQDEQAKQEDTQKLVQQQKLKQGLREVLDTQVKEKEELLFKDLEFTNHELRVNRGLYESALGFLAET